MEPRDVGRNYDQIAYFWQSKQFPRDNGIAQHVKAIAFTERRGPALDIGCGSSGRLIDLLLQRGFAAEGLDISARMLELAQRRHPQISFHHADICEWQAPYSYDFISAWDSIWHVPLRSQEGVLLKNLNHPRFCFNPCFGGCPCGSIQREL